MELTKFFFQVSIYELARSSEFATLPVIPENFIKDHYGKYSCKFIILFESNFEMLDHVISQLSLHNYVPSFDKNFAACDIFL